MAKKQSQVKRRKIAIEKQKQAKQRKYRLIGITGLLLLIFVVAFSFLGNESETTSVEGREVAAKVGAEAPDFELVSSLGQTMALSDYRGQPVAVMFMHTW